MKTTSFQYLAEIAGCFASLGISKAIISPGSRCAPIIIAFNRQPGIDCFSIVDERSAAFYALGMAQQSRKPVVLICTSGTALLNYSPAIAEAFYQKIPLIVLSADRPPEMINRNIGQTMNQENVYKNYIKKYVNLICNPISKEEIKHNIDSSVNSALTALQDPNGPVQINIPLREPLYNLSVYNKTDLIYPDGQFDKQGSKSLADDIVPDKDLNEEIEGFYQVWKGAEKKLIIVGQINHPTEELKNILSKLNKKDNVVIFSETTSNTFNDNFFNQYDRIAFALDDSNKNILKPDLVITLGDAIVSKKIKEIISSFQLKNIYHIGHSNQHPSPFSENTIIIRSDPEEILNKISGNKAELSDYYPNVLRLDELLYNFHLEFTKNIPWSDFLVMDHIYKHLPHNCQLQLSNSTPVRYSNLWKISKDKRISVFSNRGVSGIDGQLSTAAGAALIAGGLTICICGDLSFFYDSNAFWNNYIPKNLKVIMINNGGGGIFRFIKGPSEIEELENYFEAKHDTDARSLCEGFGINYYSAVDQSQLKHKWNIFLNNAECSVLEIKTDGKTSGDVLKAYFKSLNKVIDDNSELS